MTRYIDADALLELFPDEIDGLQTYNAEVQAIINSQPTIDAIPVSYIEKHIENNYRLADEMRAKRLYDVANSISQYAAQIKLFLEDWYEENV